MFVLNFKLDYKKLFIFSVIVAITIASIIELKSKNDSLLTINKENYDYILTEENYLSILKNVHENIDNNVNKTVKLSGFVFKMPDFKEEYFVCGRNTIIENEDNVAGFLCSYDDSKNLIDNEWIEITGVISKGEYNGKMPIIKVGNIKKIPAPANTFVK